VPGQTSPQRIRYLRASDGVRLAWADVGSGPVLVKASNWLTHLEFDWESPVWKHWVRFFSARFRLIRYDHRGCGMSDRSVADLSFERMIADLESVVEAAAPKAPVALLGLSAGAPVCAAYAARHPERVSRLVLYGGYARGWSHRPDAGGQREHEAMIELTRSWWGRDNPAFRQLFTSRFVPEGTREQLEWWNELCRKSTTPETAAALLRALGDIDVLELLRAVRVPTLIAHCREDVVVPLGAGRQLATEIPGAQFVELESRNHVLLEGEPAWRRFCDAITDFLGVAPAAPGAEDPAFEGLSSRERAILTLITRGLGNAQIGEELGISEKTVRNHVSRVFDKLGVWTRAQAIVFARDRGFGPDADAAARRQGRGGLNES
jgi:pimeloyl-ACP methyl ester carboxylesterase/DNA-binding CsgD family transcriptional regulator